MGKKINNKIKNKDIGDMGIGALIIFIAMVLVAGIAASVLIQTSTSLQTQVLATGTETTYAISSGILVEGIEGYNASGSISRLAIEIRPRAGAPDIDLNTTLIEISNSTAKFVLKYDSGTFTDSPDIGGDIFNCSFPGSPTINFGLIILQDEDDSCTNATPVINFGDHIILAVGDVFGGLQTRTDVSGYILPEQGSPGVIDFRTPESFFDTIIDLQ